MAHDILASTRELTNHRATELLRYEPDSGHLYWRSSGTGKRTDRPAGTVAPEGYIKIRVDGRLYRAHRLAWLMTTGRWPANEIDHLNGNKADNRWANLRDVDHHTNVMNRQLTSRSNSTGLTGVYPKNKRFVAILCRNGKSAYLGTFDTASEAHQAYQVAKAAAPS